MAAELGLADALLEAEIDRLDEAERDAEGLAETDADGVGLTDADEELRMASRTANVTIARSSLVALVPPTARLPCPGVVSIKTHAHSEPMSMSGPAVLLAPAVGGVWCP